MTQDIKALATQRVTEHFPRRPDVVVAAMDVYEDLAATLIIVPYGAAAAGSIWIWERDLRSSWSYAEEIVEEWPAPAGEAAGTVFVTAYTEMTTPNGTRGGFLAGAVRPPISGAILHMGAKHREVTIGTAGAFVCICERAPSELTLKQPPFGARTVRLSSEL